MAKIELMAGRRSSVDIERKIFRGRNNVIASRRGLNILPQLMGFTI